ncbi:hypothetical protein L227DRAFT_615609 [Lentinus tigrinus ALCF2SS1-6]|uniref:Uncharacterized protein n=1 Tax=Lentinus tigrinus ALCF2SS1-6 TaxID=1328759 RepID=A0A5C2RVR7_9APHY|nr:hypothetical protein L227DRAFT_615609 [Lentinus tigrinus ALCF2SS1-6]
MQNITPREMTPSPSFREKQRTIKAHSMPAVPSVGQILAASQNGQLMYPQAQQPSPTASNSSHQSRRSPPPTSRISPTAPKLASQTDRAAERQSSPPPPPLLHAHSTPVVPQLANQSVPNPHHPRPVPRGAPPPFLSQFNPEDRWAVTEELMAEFEREHFTSHPAGTAGVAYAGGAASGGVKRRDSLNAPAKDPAVERVRAADRASPKDSDSGGAQVAKRQVSSQKEREMQMQAARESPKARERSGTVSSQHAQDSHVRTPEYRGSPQYQTPIASPGERTAGYTQYVQEGYQSQPPPQSATQTVPRKPVPASVTVDANSNRLTPPTASKLATNTHTPPLQVMNARPPDRSLPLQEPEEDNGHEYDHDQPEYTDRHLGSPTPSSDLYPEGHTTRYDTRHEHRDDDDDDDDGTLNEEGDDHLQQNKSSEDSESGFTPRSPSTTLPERPRDAPYAQQANQYVDNQKTIRLKHRSGTTDQLGMRSFDPTLFERDTVNSLRNGGQEAPASAPRERASQSPQQVPQVQAQQHAQSQSEPPRQQQQQPQPQFEPHPHPMNLHHILDQRFGYGWNQSSAQSDDMQSLFDDPTSSYLQTFLRSASARPGAPVPPTPQSHTAAPSPSPLISATPSDVERRQIGSPYPYPFTHIRRSTVSGGITAPSTSYDNNPNVIREQMALQMQIYALNNGLAPPSSDSAFSPSSTPFPGPGYNPWAFVPAGGGLGLNGQSIAASIRSSPSHEPVNLPPPPMRGRKQNGQFRGQQTVRAVRRMKPPPRVDSTQPRETSPEPSSGEETAGEERFVDQYVRELEGSAKGKLTGEWDDSEVSPLGEGEDNEEWIDEEDDGDEDLLDLEYHPQYVNNTQKRRRRFDTRWDALVQAFQALDRETDATLVLLASPSHSTKLHALTSRSIRRDPALTNSTALASVKRSFSHLASQRRAARKAQRISLVERLSSSASADGSPGGGSPGEMDLRRALETALGSLGALQSIYDQREARWREEMRRLNEDRGRVELLLTQALGTGVANMNMNGYGFPAPAAAGQLRVNGHGVPGGQQLQ